MKKVYISGPISGHDFNHVKESFAKAEKELVKAGFEVINSVKDIIDTKGHTYSEYLRKDIVNLLSCDYICILDGYLNSEGCLLEISIANKCGIKQIAIR